MSTVKNINYYVKETDVNQTGNSLNTGSFEIIPIVSLIRLSIQHFLKSNLPFFKHGGQRFLFPKLIKKSLTHLSNLM